MSEQQEELFFAEDPAPQSHLPDPRSDLFAEIGALWRLPVGQVAHVNLIAHNMSDLQGRIELARAPDLPFDRREALALRIGTIEFSSRQVVSWSLA